MARLKENADVDIQKDLCSNCNFLARPGFGGFCCWRCSESPGEHGPLCLRQAVHRQCDQCNELKDLGWAMTGENGTTWWCYECWKSWLKAQPQHRPPLDISGPVLVLSLPKCGTTALQNAFDSIGLWSLHCYAPKPWATPEERFVGYLIRKAIKQGMAPLALLPKWVNAISQMDCWWLQQEPSEAYGIFPQIEFLEILDAAYPDAKFIFSTRDPHKWLGSVNKYGPLRAILEEADLPGLPQGVGTNDSDLINWFQNHNERVRTYFAGRSTGSFLEISLEDGDADNSAKLADFFGRPVQWGHHNVTTW